MMKHTLLFALLFCSFSLVKAQSQPVSGCNGTRYVDQVFSGVDVDIFIYGSNVNAGGGPSSPLYMDVYTPKGDTAKLRPAIVLAHGGTFIFGEKNDMSAYCVDLAKRGYVAVTIQYRLWPAFSLGVPDSVEIMRQAVMAMGDMKAAIRYLREDAATTKKYGVHPDWIYSGGYSAGGVAALAVGQLDILDELPAFLDTAVANLGGIHGNTGSVSNRTYRSDVRGVINMSGGMYSPTWIDADDKPMFSIHGTADATVNYNVGLAANIVTLHGSGNLHPRATAVGLLNKLQTVPGAGHTDLYTTNAYAPEITKFLKSTVTSLNDMFCKTSSSDDLGNEAQSWTLSPNPSDGVMRIDLPVQVIDAQLFVFSAFGKLCYRTNVKNGDALALDQLPTGLYFARVEAAGYQLPVLKWVKE
jgi:acetyl esterase/lipase